MPPHESSWMTAVEAGAYLKRSRKFILREIKAGRMKGARVSGRGRGEILTRREWLDQWVEDRLTPIPMPFRGPRR